MRPKFVWCVVAALTSLALAGCPELVRKVLPKKAWHERFNWKAEDYFDDPEVIALCHAIEANDVGEIDRLVAAGANVNAQGKDKMTPLLWAFPENKFERFNRLLEHGADPNVIVKGDFGTGIRIRPGTSVTHMSIRTTFPTYFEAVFKHGGDPNLEKETLMETPLDTLIRVDARNKKQWVRFLIEKGANIDHVSANGTTATMLAVQRFDFDIALMLLETGADHMIHRPRSSQRLVHMALANKSKATRNSTWTPQQEADYQALVRWLEKHGESLEEARVDRERWKSWSMYDGEYRRKMDAEIAARKAREPRPKPEEYFDDPKVIALCRAIDSNDLAEIDRLVADGANVNAQGKGTMTPLLWAFPPKWVLSDPPGKLDSFKRLLKQGANPNVVIHPDSKMRTDDLWLGDSVTHLAAKTAFSGYFEAVFEHGGDPNFLSKSVGSVDDTPLTSVIKGAGNNREAKIRLLLAKGADINHRNRAGVSAVMAGGGHDIRLMLLESGASHRFYYPNTNKRLIHKVLEQGELIRYVPAKKQSEYYRVLRWLEDHGESVPRARADLQRWKLWSRAPLKNRHKFKAEIAARKAREARNKNAERDSARRTN